MKGSQPEIEAIDLFCGIGGLTKGLQQSGIRVVAGVDNDQRCRFGYEYNSGAKFLLADISTVRAKDLARLYTPGAIRVLAGCAPCQPYSGLNQQKRDAGANIPIKKFARLVREMLPEVVTMENVGRLTDTKKYPVFGLFLRTLKRSGYKTWYQVINAADYGVPQMRRRLVLLASRSGRPIRMVEPTHKNARITVRDVIGDLPAISDGRSSPKDPLHYARKLSPMNMARIRATPRSGGSARAWSKDLLLECYKKESGQTYMGSVYGRMRWDQPAPTMTTQCIGLGNGRFGHPTQHRAISLREAAIFQTFPRTYVFADPKQSIRIADIARFIGNAVPVKLGKAIGSSIKQHISPLTAAPSSG